MGLKQEISRNIRDRRKALKLTQDQLAKRCRKTIRYINHLENAGSNVTVETLEKVARALDCQAVDLIGGPEPTRPGSRDWAAFTPRSEDQSLIADGLSESEAIDLAIKILREAKSKHKLR